MDTTQLNLIIAPRIQRDSRQNEARNQQPTRENTADAFAQMLRDQMKTSRQTALSVGSSLSGGPATTAGSGQQNGYFAGDMAMQQRQAVTDAANQRVSAKAAERNRLNDEQAQARIARNQDNKEAQAAAAEKTKETLKDGKDVKEAKDAKKDTAGDKPDHAAATAEAKPQPGEAAKAPQAQAQDDQQNPQDGKKQQDQPQQQAADANAQPADADAEAAVAPTAAASAPVGSAAVGKSDISAAADAKTAAAGAGQNMAPQPGTAPAGQAVDNGITGNQADNGQGTGVPGQNDDAQAADQTGDQATGLAGQQPNANPAAALPVEGDAGKAPAPQSHAPINDNPLPPKPDKTAPILPSLPTGLSDAAKAATAASDKSPLQVPPAKGLAESPAATKSTGPVDLVRAPQAVAQAAQPQQLQQTNVTPAAAPVIDKSSMDADSSFNSDTSGDFDDGAGSFGGLGSWQMPQLNGLNAARQADFVATLKQQLGTLPPHEQVAVQMQRAAQECVDKISIQLSPEELGRIHVKMDIDDEKKVRASVTVERPATLELLQRDSRALERALQDAGLKTDGGSLSFNLQRGNTGDFSDSSGWGQGNGRQAGSADQANSAGLTEAPPVKAAEIDTANGIVDVQV